MLKNIATLFLIICFFVDGNSQEIFHQKITTVDGLPSNSVYDIMQDNKGFIWFATDEGVCRFDGRHFKSFKSKNKGGKSGSFIKKDNFGRIWYENFDGYLNYIQNDSVYKLQQQDQPIGFVNYAVSTNQLIYATQKGVEIRDLKTLKIIKKQNLPDFQTCFLENINQKNYFFDPYLKVKTIQKNGFTNNTLQTKLVAPIFTKSDFIYCTDKSNTNNCMYKIENGKVTSLFNFKSELTIQNFYFLQNKFWLCTNKGLFVLDKNGNDLTSKPYFNNFSITSFFIDKENNYWVGTLNDGVVKFSDFNEIQIDLKEIKPLLLSQNNSKLLIGSADGKIFEMSKYFQNIKEIPLRAKNQILYINTSNLQYNFIAADGLYQTDKNFKVKDKQMYALKSIDFVNENEAIVALSGFVGFLNMGKQISKSAVGNFTYVDKHFRLKENVRGKCAVWNTIENEALFLTNTGLYSYKNNRLSELQLPNKKIGIRSVKKAKNAIYILSDDDKVYKYNNGVFNPIITCLNNISFIKSINNTIYIGTKNAVYELKNDQLHKTTVINVSEKIQDLQTDDDFYYVLFNSNIVRFSKNNLKPTKNKTSIYLEKFWVNKEDYTFKNKQNLSYFENDIEIQVAMIDLKKSNAIYYRINNQLWKEILNNGNILELSSLTPNQYQIEFSTQINGPILQKVNFEIQKPFWEKLWFFILISFLITALIIATYYNRLKQITTKNNLIIDKLKLENYLNESKVKLIKAQMNPHFFFNALNTIQSYISTNETDEATRYLNKFSRLTRMILEMTDKNWIAIEDELRMQTLYLDLQKVRLSDFDFQIEMNQKNMQQITIPTMLLQPYIENAIIHGLAHKLGSKRLFLDFNIEDDRLVISIKDNGIGIEKATKINLKNAAKNTSFATKATLERLEIINRNEFEISVETNEIFDANKESEGTEVKITMKIHYEL